MEHVRQLTELEINSRAEEVFTAMSPRCTIEEMELMRRAYQLAHDAHANQKRMTCRVRKIWFAIRIVQCNVRQCPTGRSKLQEAEGSY